MTDDDARYQPMLVTLSYPNARDCAHGLHRGNCDLCDYAEEIAALERHSAFDTAELVSLREECAAKAEHIATLEAAIRAHRAAVNAFYSDAESETNWVRGMKAREALWALVGEP